MYNLGSCNSAAFSMGEHGERGRERERASWRAVQSLVFMAQLEIAALKQAIISLPLPFFCLPHCCAMKCLPSPSLPLSLLTLFIFLLYLFLSLSSSSSSPSSLLAPHSLSLSLSFSLSLYSSVLWEPFRKIICCCWVFYSTGGSEAGFLAGLLLAAPL